MEVVSRKQRLTDPISNDEVLRPDWSKAKPKAEEVVVIPPQAGPGPEHKDREGEQDTPEPELNNDPQGLQEGEKAKKKGMVIFHRPDDSEKLRPSWMPERQAPAAKPKPEPSPLSVAKPKALPKPNKAEKEEAAEQAALPSVPPK